MVEKRDDFSDLRKRITLTLFLAYGVSLIFFFGYSLFTFPEKYFLLPFRLSWTLLKTAAYFIETLTAVHGAGILLACSLFAPPSPAIRSGLQESFRRLISSTVLIFLLLGIGYVALSEGLLPSVNRRLSELENRTTIARNYLDLAREAKENDNRALQQAYLEYYLSIDPDNQTAITELSELRSRRAIDPDSRDQAESRPRARLMDLHIDELFARAQAAVEEEDYYTAYYFADLALALSRGGTEDFQRARELTDSIQERLSEFRPDAEELERQAVFEIKTQAHSDLSSHDLQLVMRAYYTFLHLTERAPEDPEAKTYLREAREKLKSMAFFRDAVERFRSMPGIYRVFYSHNLEVVSIGGVITTENGRYVQDLEAITFTENGEVTRHFRAAAGKVLVNEEGVPVVYMVGIDRTDSSNTLIPEFFRGEPQDTFRLAPSIEELQLLGSDGRDIASHYLNPLWGMWETVSRFGYPADPIQIAALKRVAAAFTFIIFSLFSLAIGWKLRPSGQFPILAGIVVVPILPAGTYFAVRIYDYVLGLLVGSSLLGWGFVPAFILLIAIQFSLIVFSIAILAAQSLKPRESKSV